MDWSGVPGAMILGLSALVLISLLLWSGQAVLNFLGDEVPLGRPGSTRNELGEPISIGPDRKSLLEGLERLATQQERDEVNEIAGTPDRLALGEPGKL